MCEKCISDPVLTVVDTLSRRRAVEERLRAVTSVCLACAQLPSTTEGVPCVSLDCAWFFERSKAERLYEEATVSEQQIDEVL